MRRFFIVSVVVSAVISACEAPTEPSVAQARYAELSAAPAFTLGSERDSVFRAEMLYWRQNSLFYYGGARVARTPERWATLWDTVVGTTTPAPPPLAVDFSTEMVVLAANGAWGNTGKNVRIVHVTRQRDTTFVLVRITTSGPNCFVGSAGISPIDARVVPVAEPPTCFLAEQYVTDCATGRSRPVW